MGIILQQYNRQPWESMVGRDGYILQIAFRLDDDGISRASQEIEPPHGTTPTAQLVDRRHTRKHFVQRDNTRTVDNKI